jgi:NRAMP (natural resistance-associated macrophage protein)-like metal ion transporter
MSICFFINWGTSGADAAALVKGWVVPSMPAYALTQTVGTIGAVIMPHNLYLHSGLVLSRKVRRSSPHKVYDAIWYARLESAGALLFAFFINLAVVAANATTFFVPSCTNRSGGPYACLSPTAFNLSGDNRHMVPGQQGAECDLTPVAARGASVSQPYGQCGEMGLSSEGYALASALGPSALYIWALGLLAAGQASTMVCTYAGQIIMGGCLQIQLKPWKRVALTRAIALGPAMLVAVSTVSDTSLFNNINEYLNILQSVQLPFAMLPVLHFAASDRLMGRFRSSPTLFAISCCLAAVVMIINVVLVIQFIQDPPSEAGVETTPPGVIVVIALFGVAYFGVCYRMLQEEMQQAYAFLLGCAGLRRNDSPQPIFREHAGEIAGRPDPMVRVSSAEGVVEGRDSHDISLTSSPGAPIAASRA